MSLKHAILGFLSLKPLSGYDLKKTFDQSVRHFWPANQSQIYRTLAELDEQGLIEKEVIPREERLDMKVYSITAAGQEELRRWLATPLPQQDYREPFLVQVFFAEQLTDAELLSLLEHELHALEALQVMYKQLYRLNQAAIHSVDDARGSALKVATLEYGIRSNQAAIDWLRSVAERVRSGNYALPDISS